jgi:hypothetical protein
MTDNVISLVHVRGDAKPELSPEHDVNAASDERDAYIKEQNTEHLTTYMKAVENDEVRSLLTIAINKDGSVNWSISGLTSSFEIIAALERTKHDFMDTE